MSVPQGSSHFPLDIDSRWGRFLKVFGVGPDDGVVIDPANDMFTARFGRLRLETPLSNVDGAHITRDYRWYTAIGARLSFADDGLTFGSNTRAGVCVHFHERVPKVLGFKDHSALTVTVADPEGLVAALGTVEPR